MNIFFWSHNRRVRFYFDLFYRLALYLFDLTLLQMICFLGLRLENSRILDWFYNSWLGWLSLWWSMDWIDFTRLTWFFLLADRFGLIFKLGVFLWIVRIDWFLPWRFLKVSWLLGMRLWLSACTPHFKLLFLIKYYFNDWIWLF